MIGQHKFFTICYAIILILVIIWLSTKVSFIFTPVLIAVKTLFLPFALAGVLFYLFRPLIDFLEQYKFPRTVSILLLFLALIGIIIAVSLMIFPTLEYQVNRLIEHAPEIAQMLLLEWQRFQTNQVHFPSYVNEAIEYATNEIQEIIINVGKNITNIIGAVTNFVVTLVIVPFILFYMLKDGRKVPQFLVQFLPEEKQRLEARTIFSEMNQALSTYVQGQVIVSLCVGIMVYIGYLIIGIDYSLILALVAMFTNVIPFVGPFIGIFPALIVGLIHSPFMMLKVIIVVVIAQQIESNLISPQIMGRSLDIHPLTIILLLLVASSLAGIIGLILAVPTYAVVKVVVKHIYSLIQLRLGYK